MHEGIDLTHLMTRLVLQLGVIVITAKAAGHLSVRYLKQPSVLGELLAGMIIGPYALGSLPLPLLGGEPLFFIPPGSALPVTPELYGFATAASLVLLFLSGLETDLKTFLKFAGVGSLVGLGGIVLSFLAGALAAVIFLPGVRGIFDMQAVFLGIVSTATSVGITARILSERRRLSSPEGVTILSAAVFDDVLGIIFLAVIIGINKAGEQGGVTDWGAIGRVALKAVLFWLGTTVVGIFVAPQITRGLKSLRDLEALGMITFGLALLLAGLSELAGLAMIIGAYVMGLALSRTDVAEDIRVRLEGLYGFIVPIFFCVMGMMVDFSAIPGVFLFGLFFSFLGIAGKYLGCGLPALVAGFNLKGAMRIGAGMLPRGEVALIMAGLGLSEGIIGPGLFGVVVISLLVSSVLTPPLLVKSFQGGSGYRKDLGEEVDPGLIPITMNFTTEKLASFVLDKFITAFREEEFFPRRVGQERPVYALLKDGVQITLTREKSKINIICPPDQENFIRLMAAEELLSLKELFKNVEELSLSGTMERDILGRLFDDNSTK